MNISRISVLLLAGSAAAFAQADLGVRMQTIAQALGVTCQHCHSAERGSGQPEPKKDIARTMIAMTRDINAQIDKAMSDLATGPSAVHVDCITCHRGVPIPKQLTEILNQTLKDQGVEAAIQQYKDLRTRYYGRATYDFGDQTMIDVARPIATRKPDDALALLNAQLEFNPKSARTLEAIAYAYTRKFDDATAITYLERAAEIEPDNGMIRGQLEQLKSYHRK
jgi:tetratricopeptide (TPR) repeat protein